VSPDAITFTSQRNGKLQLAGACEWSFNLSHTDGLMLVAVSNGVQVGVDVEKIRPIEGAKRIAARYFSAKECESLEVDPASFFRLWTRRESALKAWGIGISQGWDSVRIVETSWETAKAIGPGPHCHVQLLTPRHGYIAALATLDRVVRSPEIRALEINPQLAGAPNGYAKTH
jgi:4'-phosphopantetheinyl transferase